MVSPALDFDVLQKWDERKNISDLLAREENEKELFFINVCGAVENSEYDLSHLTDLELKNKLIVLIESYKPNKTQSTDLKMTIILFDDIPVCGRARRLALPKKREVEK